MIGIVKLNVQAVFERGTCVFLLASSRASLAPTENMCRSSIPVGARLAREEALNITKKPLQASRQQPPAQK
jgi:hypothetical protein